MTTPIRSWASDIDADARKADDRMRAIVGSIDASGQNAATGVVGDEDPLQRLPMRSRPSQQMH